MTKLTEREELISAYSDGYKDLNGFRPRDAALYRGPIEALRAAVDRVYADLAEEIEREREEAEAEAQWWVEADLAREEAEATPETFPTSGEGWSFTAAN